jgi:hypothetical protein
MNFYFHSKLENGIGSLIDINASRRLNGADGN